MSETLVGGWKKRGNPGKKQQFVASTKLYIFRWFASYNQNGYKMVFSDGLPNERRRRYYTMLVGRRFTRNNSETGGFF